MEIQVSRRCSSKNSNLAALRVGRRTGYPSLFTPRSGTSSWFSLLRSFDPHLLVCRGTFVHNLRVPGVWHAVIIRGPHAHARIRKVRTTVLGSRRSGARGMLGVASGLGYYILDTRDRLAYPELMAVILLIGLVGYILDAAIRLIRRRWVALPSLQDAAEAAR